MVALWGGVDSSVTAALLHYAGYEVIGLTLQLYDYGAATAKKGACCAGQDIYDAKKVAAMLGIPHYVMDMESKFQEAVIQDFADSYARGETPVPCIQCNQTVKFQDLLSFAKDLGAKALATGHYVRREKRKIPNDPFENARLYCGHDESKDQSYFLFATHFEQLNYLRFPLGKFSKAQTRELAMAFNLSNAQKPDSQDICFVPNGNYAKIVEKLRPDAFIAGDIIDIHGNVLGQHQGIANYTIGQRKGLGIGGRAVKEGLDNSPDNLGEGHHAPLYVIALEPKKSQVVVGEKEFLAIHAFYIERVNWLGDGKIEDFPENQSIYIRIRNNMTPILAKIRWEGNQVKVEPKQPLYGLSAGQACVFYVMDPEIPYLEGRGLAYEGLRVMGGGWIKKSENKYLTNLAPGL